ncbi:hypothetical protein CDAR_280051 [Caerostris darwini]|uniref:Uncharacterized protein n=1 Tax=Caerostris darwini TaxID=1538125 RepID=A0AAV4S9A9_9ARAC|nr:hypothetical protein CDAR_280051 [Caerostris darwini]
MNSLLILLGDIVQLSLFSGTLDENRKLLKRSLNKDVGGMRDMRSESIIPSVIVFAQAFLLSANKASKHISQMNSLLILLGDIAQQSMFSGILDGNRKLLKRSLNKDVGDMRDMRSNQ